jgi:phospholipid/cholesterol/gamma-HCH transport system substrate-binding protein
MRNRALLIGLFVLGGLTLFTVGLFLVGNRKEAFSRHVQFYTEFKNLAGMSKGSKVKVAGMDAGQIIDVGVPDTPASGFRVKFQINQRFQGLVRTDSVATIATEGVVGGTFLLVRPGSPQAVPASPLATLPSQEPIDISKLLEKGLVLVQDADATVKQIGPKLGGTLDEAKTTVVHVDDVVTGLKKGRGTVGMLLQDKDVASEIRSSVTNVKQATVHVRDASGQANALVSDIRSRGVAAKVDETISSARDAAANIDQTSKQIRKTVTAATEPDEQGVDAGTNLKESLSNVNTATANMADDAEALKHNFFLRGFFHRRGYYNLDNLPPDTYRKDRVFSDPANGRAWLPAAQLFTVDASNVEILSAVGKQLLNAAMAQHGDSVLNHPIIVEGYSEGYGPADELPTSRNRALVVREYLRRHYQLDSNKLGAVSLSNSPPERVGHSHWDGICVVFLKRSQ